jgi:hypothetical protein
LIIFLSKTDGIFVVCSDFFFVLSISRFISLKMSLRTQRKNQSRHVIVVCATEKCKWRNFASKNSHASCSQNWDRLKHNNGEMIEKHFAANTTQQLSIMVQFFSLFSYSNMTSFLCNSWKSRKRSRTDFRFLFKCQNAVYSWSWLKDIKVNFTAFPIFQISARTIRTALTTIKFAILMATHYFYCYMQLT